MIAKRLKALRLDKGLERKELAAALGMPYTTYTNYETGSRDPNSDVLQYLARFYGVSVDYILGLTDSPLPVSSVTLTLPERRHIDQYRALDAHGKEITDIVIEKETARIEAEKLVKKDPWLDDNEIVTMRIYDLPSAAGVGNYLYDYGENEYEEIEYRAADIPAGADFGVRISGDSMEPRIFDGEIAWVKEQHEIESGQIGIFVVDGEAYCKQLVFVSGGGGVWLESLNEAYEPIRINYDMNARAIGVVVGTTQGRRQSWR